MPSEMLAEIETRYGCVSGALYRLISSTAMGNSASNANNPPRQPRQTSTSPGPGNPHRSLRTKKRSLELPDLASLSLTPTLPSRGRQAQAKTASIPIPTLPPPTFNDYRSTQTDPPQRAPVHLPSTTDVLSEQYFVPPPFAARNTPHPNHYQSTQSTQSAPRGRQQAIQVQRLQDLYDRSQHSAAPPSSPATFSSIYNHTQPKYVPEVVHSSIPIVLGARQPDAAVQLAASPVKEDLLADPVEVKIVWKGGGGEVVLARAGDDEWKGRTKMQKESPNSNVWTLTVLLQPGTHHVRFLVDGQWRVADDLPAAVDDQGSLANYVAVPLHYGIPGAVPPLQVSPPPPPTIVHPQVKKVIPGQSFWSADSSADGETEDGSSGDTAGKTQDANVNAKHHAPAALASYAQAAWTNVLPPELIEAAREEEVYLAASAGQYDTNNNATTRVTGFVPAPNIPPAPGLPRHLDKLILNSKVGEQRPGAPGSGGSNSGHGHGGSGIGSGQGGGRRERREHRERGERERGERDRDRERERGERGTRRRGNVPPAPPPSEAGELSQEREEEEREEVHEPQVNPPLEEPPQPGRYMPAQLLNLHNQPVRSAAVVEATLAAWGSTPASGSGTSSSLPSSGTPGTPAVPASASGGTLASSSSRGATPMGGISASASAAGSTPGSGAGTGGTTTAATSPQASLPATPTGPLSPHQTPPKTQWGPSGGSPTTRQQVLGGVVSSLPTTPGGTNAGSSLQPPAISGSRAITIDDANMPALTDDASVLPVPSHVVLHHLCTSAIRNGVLAVANTTRYKKKYLTTIYYKPT